MNRIVTPNDPILEMQAEFAVSGVPVSRVVQITPDIAARLLENNPDNRRISDDAVRNLAGDISQGRWQLNGEAIIISDDGLINDGQHRLWAIVEAARSVNVIVVYGVTRDSRSTVDIGRARTVSNILGLEGTTNSVICGVVAGTLLRLEDNPNRIGKAHSKTEVIEYYKKHKDEIDRGIALTHHYGKASRTLGGESLVVVLRILLTRRCSNELMLEDFWAQLLGGTNLIEGSPVLYVRNRVQQDKVLKMTQRLELMIRAWNAFRDGRSVKTLPVTGNIPPIEQ